jgi:hypothetical protein
MASQSDISLAIRRQTKVRVLVLAESGVYASTWLNCRYQGTLSGEVMKALILSDYEQLEVEV